MLQKLYIKNFLLIKEETLTFEPGLNLLTGETGTGKSLVVGAIRALLGERIKFPAQTGTILEGYFRLDKPLKQHLQQHLASHYDIEDDILILRREWIHEQRSRCFLNDTPISQSLLKELLQPYIEIHSQHESHELLKAPYQLRLLDSFANLKDNLELFAKIFDEYEQLKTKVETLTQQIQSTQERYDLLQFQWQELQQAHLDEIDFDALEKELTLLSRRELYQQKLWDAYRWLYEQEGAVIEQISQIRRLIEEVPTIDEVHEQLETITEQLKWIANQLAQTAQNLESDPERLKTLQEQYDKLQDLMRKYRVASVDALKEKFHAITEQLQSLETKQEQLEQLQSELKTIEERLWDLALTIEKKRLEAAKALQSAVNEQLVFLNLKDAEFFIDLQRLESGTKIKEGFCNKKGINKVVFKVRTHPSLPAGTLDAVASGGERSRILLALKVILAQSLQARLLILDEVDTGISGITAMQVARTIERLAQHKQIIAITHLPQLASRKGKHFVITKEKGATLIKPLETPQQRIEEIARLLGGTLSKAAIENAKSLLQT